MDTRRTFGWNEVNARDHLGKHGIPFDAATSVFLDPLRIDRPDTRFDYGEERRITVGSIGTSRISVVYTMRGGVTWIISARPASRKERGLHDRGKVHP